MIPLLLFRCSRAYAPQESDRDGTHLQGYEDELVLLTTSLKHSVIMRRDCNTHMHPFRASDILQNDRVLIYCSAVSGLISGDHTCFLERERLFSILRISPRIK
jgi:hypothetical protein